MEIVRDPNNIPFIKKKKQEDIIKELANLATIIENYEKLFKEVAEKIEALEKKLEEKEVVEKESKKSKS